MHVDGPGRPLHRRRFAAVDSYYNGQARIERLDGGLEIIDETGAHVMELRPAPKSEFAALPDTVSGLALAYGLEPDRARRLLRALAELHLVADVDGVWRATGRCAFLAAGHPWTLADAAAEYGRSFPGMWESLPQALRADGNWHPPDIFKEVGADPARVASHHRMLASYAQHDYGPVPDALDLRGNERVIDAGGGLGALAGLLVEARPQLRITVLDRPEVVERAACMPQPDRVTFQAGDIFEPWGIEGDVAMLARVLHDWDEGSALRILRHARRALPSGGRLFAVEMVLPEVGCLRELGFR